MIKFDFHLSVDHQLKANGYRFDANETAAFSRELEYVHNEVIEAKYPDLKWRNCLPIKSGAPLGITSHRWFETDGFGDAEWLENMALEEFPTAEVQGAENTGTVKSLGAKYIVTIEDLRAAQLMRRNVEAEKARLVRRGIEAKLDKAAFGTYNTTNGGFKGILHDDMSTAYTPHATLGSNGNWFHATTGAPANLVYDVRKMTEKAFIDTKGAFSQFDLFLCPEMGVLLDAPMYFEASAGVKNYINQNVGQYMLSNIPRLRSITTDMFRGTNAGNSKHRALLYPRDPEVFDAFVPLDFEQFAPQLSGMAFVTPCHAKYAGIRMKHKAAVIRLDSSTSA